MIRISLPWPPTLNTYWRSVPVGRSCRMLISKKGRAYRRRVARELLAQTMPYLLVNLTPLTGPLSVEILAYPPDKRVRDLDNLPKSIFDALTAAQIWGDDGQIDYFSVTRCPLAEGGRVDLIISEYTW